MEDEFLEWYKENETRFHQGHLDEKEIAYSAWLEGQKAGQHETIVMPPLSIKAKRTMPVEMVVRKEYEQIKTFYKDVFHLLGSMNYDPNAKNVNELLNRAKAFVDKHEY